MGSCLDTTGYTKRPRPRGNPRVAAAGISKRSRKYLWKRKLNSMPVGLANLKHLAELVRFLGCSIRCLIARPCDPDRHGSVSWAHTAVSDSWGSIRYGRLAVEVNAV